MTRLYILALGSLITSVGSGLSAFGLAVFAYSAYGTASAVALVQLCAFAPIVLLAPLAGTLADRFDRRLMMVLGDAGSVLGLAVVWAALASREPKLVTILFGVVLSSCLAALTEPALRASVTDLVDPQDHVRASGLLQAAGSARYLLAPALAGALLPVVGLRTLIVLDAATCIVTVACSLTVMRAVGRRSAATWEETGTVHQLLAGWRLIRRTPTVRRVVGLMTVMTLTIGTLQVLLKPILLPLVGTAATGRVETLAATGILAGAALVTLLAGRSPSRLLSAGTAATGVAMCALALREEAWWVALSGFGVFAALAVCQAGAETLVRRGVDADHQARMWGTVSLVTQTGYILACLGAGPLADGVATALLAPGGALAPALSAVVGTGPGRGAALVVALAGLATIALAAVIRSRLATSDDAITPPVPSVEADPSRTRSR
ncbi:MULTISPECIES: MFS transporter [Actinomyces]|uniref:MFS transporter n=1 Tax=Actinomyces respiraculi TaxID=2744574 RepID=A0A7T0PX90_9ACTO|nr:MULTISPECIES: MFS transporter [Actinomyces]QPL06248.1 MFS transporter [Actinomyces respiraculi]